ncbi:MAG: thioredoxin family protein [Chloroflexota bacterium]
MAVTREQFESGLSYDAYKRGMTRNQERFEANERGVSVRSDDLAAFNRLPKPVNVLVIGEDWCGDVIANMPIIGRLASESGKLNLRVFERDKHPELMDQYLNQGKYKSIPVFVFFDDDFREIGRFIERPASVTELRAKKQREIHAAHPEFGEVGAPLDQLPENVRTELATLTAKMREDMVPFANQEVIRELREIVERVPARTGG